MRANHEWITGMLGTTVILACILLPVSAIAAEPSVNEQLLQEAKNGSVEQIKTLLAKGGDPNSDNNKSKTGLMEALWAKDIELAKSLINNGADVNVKGARGRAPLVPAAAWGNLEIVKLLLDKGADVNAKDEEGSTVLMVADQWTNPEVAKLLIDKGLDVHAKNKTGETILVCAALTGQLEFVNSSSIKAST
jgi:ankyrin repeat protein